MLIKQMLYPMKRCLYLTPIKIVTNCLVFGKNKCSCFKFYKRTELHIESLILRKLQFIFDYPHCKYNEPHIIGYISFYSWRYWFALDRLYDNIMLAGVLYYE